MADQPSFRHSSSAVRFHSTPASKAERHTMTPRTHDRRSALDNTAATFTPLLTPNRAGEIVLLSPSKSITETITEITTCTTKELEHVWDELGYSPEERAQQLNDLIMKFRKLCETKIADEHKLAETYLQTIRDSKNEIESLSKALNENIDYDILKEQNGLSLSDELEALDVELKGLRAKAQVAREDLKECRDFLIEAYEALGLELEPMWREINSDLTSTRREEFHAKRTEMKEEVASRTAAVIQLVLDCQKVMNELRIDTQNGNEIDRRIAGSLIRSKDDSFIMASRFRSDSCVGIGSTALNELTQRLSELHGERRQRRLRLQELGAEISVLWEKLDVTPEEQQAFTASVKGISLETIEKGEAELKRLNGIKANMMGKLIADARETIKYLWEQTNADQAYCDSFEPMHVTLEELFDDDLLEKHEIYIGVLNDRLEEMKPILTLIERREVIVEERLQYEKLQEDSERLKQRGAEMTRQLMEEEKMAKRIKRDLPKLTELLIGKLSDWQEKHGENFKYSGRNYLDIMEEQEEEWHGYKEQKHQRMLHKKQEEKVIGEIRFVGSKKPRGRQPLGNGQDRANSGIVRRGKSRDPSKFPEQTLGQKTISSNF